MKLIRITLHGIIPKRLDLIIIGGINTVSLGLVK